MISRPTRATTKKIHHTQQVIQSTIKKTGSNKALSMRQKLLVHRCYDYLLAEHPVETLLSLNIPSYEIPTALRAMTNQGLLSEDKCMQMTLHFINLTQ